MTGQGIAIGVIAALAIAARTAAAEPSEADVTFTRGRALYKQQKWADAYEQFKRSEHLDPAIGTVFEMADCEDHLGMLATARAHFAFVAAAEQRAEHPNAQRLGWAKRSIAELDARMPHVVIALVAPVPGVHVTLDGADITAELAAPIAVDLGAHVVVAEAPGRARVQQNADASAERATVRVAIALDPIAGAQQEPPAAPVTPPAAPPPAAPAPPPAATSPVATTPAVTTPTAPPPVATAADTTTGTAALTASPSDANPSWATQHADSLRVGGIAAMVVGGITTAVGLSFGADAMKLRLSSNYYCYLDGPCPALGLAHTSTAITVPGAVVLAAGIGVYIWGRRAAGATIVAPDVGADHVGAAIVGRF